MNDKKILFNESCREINIQLDNMTKSFTNLSEVLSGLDLKFKSEYHCPQCNNILYYDFIGEERVRLFCPNCERYVFVKINKFE